MVYLSWRFLDSWKCKQSTVPKSSTEAEYHAMSSTCNEIVCLSYWMKLVLQISLLSMLTISVLIASNPMYHKHIEVDCHFIRHLFQDGIITLLRCMLTSSVLIASNSVYHKQIEVDSLYSSSFSRWDYHPSLSVY